MIKANQDAHCVTIHMNFNVPGHTLSIYMTALSFNVRYAIVCMCLLYMELNNWLFNRLTKNLFCKNVKLINQ